LWASPPGDAHFCARTALEAAPDTAPQTDTVRDRLAELATIAASRIVV
jgi:hypothetical protein